jgi:hypothetical protein
MKLKDLPKERGDILNVFITIDSAISMIISKHYLGDAPPQQSQINKEIDFLVNVMGNDQCTFALKRNIFTHILRNDNLDASLLEEVHRLNKLRNIFAHSPWITNENPQTQESEVYYQNPKFPWDKSKNILAEDLKKEFNSLAPDVINWLYNLAKKKGYVFPEISKQATENQPPSTISLPRVGQLVDEDGTVYYVGDRALLGIPDLPTFNSWGFSFKQVVPANIAEKALPHNGRIPLKKGSFTDPLTQINDTSESKIV